jgi:hypothetical protein
VHFEPAITVGLDGLDDVFSGLPDGGNGASDRAGVTGRWPAGRQEATYQPMLEHRCGRRWTGAGARTNEHDR